jgi:hypothetical protein
MMSVKAKFFRVVGGRIGESWQKIREYDDIAWKRFMATSPPVGASLSFRPSSIAKYLTPEELKDFQKHNKYFFQYWKKERAKARKLKRVI